VDVLGPIRRQKTLTEQSADAIRARIISGEFQFGEALSEITLAAELGVSKTPVREAFLQLKNEGLVEILPQRGTFVFRMTNDQLRQLAQMREMLEINALQLAMRTGGDALARALEGNMRAMSEAAEAKNPVVYRRFDGEFHQAFITASGNAFIVSAYNIIALRIQAFRNRLSLDAQNWRSLDEHGEVARLVRLGDCDAAAKALLAHIRGALRDYFARVEKELARAG